MKFYGTEDSEFDLSANVPLLMSIYLEFVSSALSDVFFHCDVLHVAKGQHMSWIEVVCQLVLQISLPPHQWILNGAELCRESKFSYKGKRYTDRKGENNRKGDAKIWGSLGIATLNLREPGSSIGKVRMAEKTNTERDFLRVAWYRKVSEGEEDCTGRCSITWSKTKCRKLELEKKGQIFKRQIWKRKCKCKIVHR